MSTFAEAVWRMRADEEGGLGRLGPALMLEALGGLEGDELEVVGQVVERLRVGRERYGQLYLSRDLRDWRRETGEEVIDGLIYAACGVLKAGMVR